jgi:hypothetical protein
MSIRLMSPRMCRAGRRLARDGRILEGMRKRPHVRLNISNVSVTDRRLEMKDGNVPR